MCININEKVLLSGLKLIDRTTKLFRYSVDQIIITVE